MKIIQPAGISNQSRYIKSLTFLLLFLMFYTKSGFSQSLGLNTTAALPDSSAMLDIVSATKGLLIPRISLASTTDTTTISHPAPSLLVYNTNVAMTGGSGLGYYYFNDSIWVNFLSGSGNSLIIPLLAGGTSTTSSLTYKPTTGVGITGADHIFQVGNNGATEALRILNNGNVGIGTAAPLAQLSVSGGTTNAGSTIAMLGGPSSAGAVNALSLVNTASSSIGNEVDLNFHLANNFGSTAKIGAILTGSPSSDLAFFTYNSGLNEKMRILANGNVGIGTSAPNSPLTVQTNSTNDGINLYGRSSDDYAPIAFYNTDKTTMNGVIQGGNVSNGMSVGTWIASPLKFYTNATEKMSILSGGNVGIGITAPSSKLDVGNTTGVVGDNTVVGSFDVINTNNGGSAILRVSQQHTAIRAIDIEINGGGSGPFRYGTYVDANIVNGYNASGGAFGAINFVTGNAGGAGIAMTIGGGTIKGLIGIGVTSPSAKLHTISTTEQLRLGYDASNYYSTTVNSTGGVSYDAVGSGSAFTFSDAVNLPTGSVGVTQSLNDSTTKLATTAFVDRAVAGVGGGSSGWGLTGTSGTNEGTNFIGTTDSIDFIFKTHNSERMRILKSNGAVGIGVTSPSAKLHTISTTEQLRLGYDASNYFSTSVNSTGVVTFDAVGSGSAFAFNDSVALPTGTTGVTQAALTNNTTLATTAFVTTATAGSSNIYEATLSVSSAQILALNTTPITIISAPGSGKVIEVISASGFMTFITAAYATNTQLQLICNGANITQGSETSLLKSTVSRNGRFVLQTLAINTTDLQLVDNAALRLAVGTGNPTAGSGTLKIKILYRIITI